MDANDMIDSEIEWRWEDMCGPGGLHPWNPKIHDMGYCFQRLFLLIPTLFLLAISSSYYVGRKVNWVIRGKLQERAILMRCVLVFVMAVLPLLQGYKFLVEEKRALAIDYFTCGTECIAWFVHFGYLLALRDRLGISPRGPVFILVLWSMTVVLSVTSLRTLILLEQNYSIAMAMLVCQINYAFTLLPSAGVTSPTYYSTTLIGSQYAQLSEHYPLLQGLVEDDGALGTAMSNVPCLSKLLFYWVQPLFIRGLENKLKDPDDLFDLPMHLSCEVISTKIDKALIGNVDMYQSSSDNFDRSTDLQYRGSYGAINRNDINSIIPSIQVVQPSRKHNVSLFRALHSSFAFEFYSVGILKLLSDFANFAGPLLLNRLVTFVESPAMDVKLGYLFAAGLLFSSLISAFCDSHFNMYMSIIGIKMRAAIISVVFRKTLSVSTRELNNNLSVGEVTNFMSTDTDRIVNSCPSFHAVWSIPLQLGVTLYLLYTQVGIAFLAGLVFSIVLIPINKYVANKIGSLSTDLMRHKDGRVGLIMELIKNIKTIKFYVWEEYFMNKILDERFKEIKYLKGRKYLDAICVFLWATTPVIVATLTLSTYALLGNQLKAATVFTTIALLNMLIAPLNAFPWVLNGLTEAWVSVKRIQRLLNLDDLNEYELYSDKIHDNEDNAVISMKNACFTWTKPNLVHHDNARSSFNGANRYGNVQQTDSTIEAAISRVNDNVTEVLFKLIDLTFNINRGDFVGIIGKVGCGKTSLFSAILAEMPKIGGMVSKSENFSGFGYVSQKPWLIQGTIRENIVFGKAYEESKYRTIVDACGLSDDLILLGNNSKVGEGGCALSGGQAARVALARAVYQDKQVYLLDDILSAVDVKIGNHIYRKCIMGLLKYKTRILITHSMQYLREAHNIIVMDNGTIAQQGPPNVILNDIDDYLNTDASDNESASIIADKISPLDNISLRDDQSNNSLLDEEVSAVGNVNFWVIAMYWKSIGHWLALAVLMSLILMQVSRNSTDIWLAYWVNNIILPNSTNLTNSNALPKPYLNNTFNNTPINKYFMDDFSWAKDVARLFHYNNTLQLIKPEVLKMDKKVSFYLSVYAGFALLNAIFTLLRAFLFAYGGIQAAIKIHKRLLKIVIKGKMKFFDITPAGRILNRFSSDTYTVDDSLPFIMNILLAQIFGVIGSIILTAYGLPWVCLVIVPLIPIYHWLQHRYRITSRELKRLNSVTLSPIYSYFNDTLEGAIIIRAFNRSSQWLQNGEHFIERCQRAIFSSVAASQWLSLRLQLMGSAILAGGAVVAVAQRNLDMVDAGLVGLAISYALSVTSLLSGVINAFTETEREMIAVERVGEYINQIEPEGKDGESNEISPPYGWPNMGIIHFNDVTMKYRPHLAPCLREVSFETLPAEKIGVVGRTGAGKSSLLISLFRLSELYSGSITIDSVDISNLELSTLRCRIAIIPQEPFIFNGSIRENLDPLKQYSDFELWNALEKSGAKQIIKHKGGLHITALGLSRGHMQLLCLTRAILQNSKILCIDEATANLDQETDRLIQETIRCVFRKSTVITIAHRISTILDSDRVLVMGDGEVLEFDKPERLLSNPDSHFYKLVNQDHYEEYTN